MTSRRSLSLLRISAQRLAASDLRDPVDVVRWMLALQSQDYPGALWSIGCRAPGSTRETVQQALASGEIVRSWPLRGTLHIVPAEDLGWILQLTAPRMIAVNEGRRRQLELSDHDIDTAQAIAQEQLSGGRVLLRSELLEAFEAGGVSTNGQRGYHLLWNLGQRATIVFGPTEGKQPTFALLAERITNARQLDREQSLREFALRYFLSHGPATVRDFAWWSSLTLTDARLGLSLARPELDSLSVEGTDYFFAPGLAEAQPTVLALSGFDELLLGYQDRSATLPEAHKNRIVPGSNGMFFPTIIDRGTVVGTWKRSEKRSTVAITTEPFGTLSARASAGFRRATREYARFLDTTPTWMDQAPD